MCFLVVIFFVLSSVCGRVISGMGQRVPLEKHQGDKLIGDAPWVVEEGGVEGVMGGLGKITTHHPSVVDDTVAGFHSDVILGSLFFPDMQCMACKSIVEIGEKKGVKVMEDSVGSVCSIVKFSSSLEKLCRDSLTAVLKALEVSVKDDTLPKIACEKVSMCK